MPATIKYLVHRCALVIPTEHENLVRVFYFETQKQRKNFEAVLCTVNVVTKEKKPCIWWRSTRDRDNAQKISVLERRWSDKICGKVKV